MVTREQFENNTSWKMSYEEFQKCDCTRCKKKKIAHIEKDLEEYLPQMEAQDYVLIQNKTQILQALAGNVSALIIGK